MKYAQHTNISLIVLLIIIALVNSQDLICPSSGILPFSCVCKESSSSVYCNSTSMTDIPRNLPNSQVMFFYANHDLKKLKDISYNYVVTLHFTSNGITDIEDFAFRNATKLKNLHIAHEQFRDLTPRTFAGTATLEYIDIQYTPLYLIKAGVFGKSLPKIMEIKLRNCGLYDIEDDAFADSDHLQYIGLQSNKLTEIPRFSTDKPLTSLTHLQLSNNKISTLENLQNLPALTHLMLENNLIVKIQSHSFDHLANRINFLALSNNHIESIEQLAFVRLMNLSELDLNNNSLSHVTWEELPWNTLSKITLYDNPWACDCKNAYLAEHHQKIDLYNHDGHNRTIRCGSPNEVKGQAIYDVDSSYFLCKEAPHSKPKHSAAVAIIVLVCLFLIGIGVVVFFNMRKWRRQKTLSPYTQFSARDGIIKYSDDEAFDA